MVKINNNFWKNKKVFITGHTGFKGAWLCLWLKFLGANILGYSLPLSKNEILFKKLNTKLNIKSIYGDISDFKKLGKSIRNFKPDIIFHLAAQPLVIDSYKKPIYTMSTNIIGTANLMYSAIGIKNLKSIVIVTSDKCYENNENKIQFTEIDKLGGDDPYSASKAASEIVANSFSKSFLENVGVATARSGNVIGGGDYANNRLIPDIIRSINNNKDIFLRHPKNTRPWQHVFETLNGYIILAEKLYKNKKKFSGPWNFGPKKSNLSVEYVTKKMIELWGQKVKIKYGKKTNFKEKKFLSLNSHKAKKYLNWKNKWEINQTISQIVKWHKYSKKYKNIYDFSLNQLIEFINR